MSEVPLYQAWIHLRSVDPFNKCGSTHQNRASVARIIMTLASAPDSGRH